MHYFNTHTHQNYPNAIINVPLASIDFDENLLYSIGVHPWDYMKYCENSIMLLNWLYEYVELPQVAAIGECGIDRNIDTEVELQEDLFQLQVKLAQKYQKPLIIHCVRAYNDILRILQQTKFTQAVVFHRFTGNEQISESFKDFDCYYSFGAELFTRTQSMEMLKSLSLDRIFLENDTADVSIEEIYSFVAKQIGISMETLCENLQKTAEKVFYL